MYHIGLDWHPKQSTLDAVDEKGARVFSRTIHGPWNKVIEALSQIKEPFEIAFEASTGYGHLHDELSRIARRVVVAHPGHLRLIFGSKQKNDRVDAHKLAVLFHANILKPVHVPGTDVRAWRRMIEHRQGLLGERTGTKNRIRALLRSLGLIAPRSLWTKKGMAWLGGLKLPLLLDQVQLDELIGRVRFLDAGMKRVEAALDEMGRNHPGVKLLMTIKGVGIRTAEAVMAYIDDPGRFGKNKCIGSYFGVVPRQDASGSMNRLGHITKNGPSTVRHLVIEATWQVIRYSPQVRQYFERIKAGDPDRRKIALVATAHHLLRVMLAMLRSGEVWRSKIAG